MFEIFLFINPIGIYCYDTERQIRKAVDELGVDVCYHYIPIANVCLINDDVIRRRKDAQKLSDISSFSKATYEALENYHAIKLAYGNKKARNYLYELQKNLSNDASAYTPDLLQRITQKMHIKDEDIRAIKQTDYLRTSIEEDQKLANQWNIKATPTTVIFNEDNEQNGVLLEGPINQCDLINLMLPDCQECIPNCLSEKNHLRLI
ncbi:DsbA family protein [uncultured Lactobacillus sp.]|uniref:DsbA family protein n=1 Tax=uncultured Lactobacillus sp. TaxID=153152 RepID=UPI00260220CD|nr:DsbA family protein [uncultured Lactobacillus sp.]